MPEKADAPRDRRARNDRVATVKAWSKTKPAQPAAPARPASTPRRASATAGAQPAGAGQPEPSAKPAEPASRAKSRAANTLARAPAAPRRQPTGPRAAAAPEPRPYHHGNLREALIEAAVAIIDEQGVEQLSVRETAKRAGVSPGAPFRHFASRAALLTAVAEQATERLAASATQALTAAAGQPPLQRLAAIGHAYLDWASAYPTHFRVISDHTQLDGGGSPATAQANEGLRRAMRALLDEALGGHASAAERERALVASRAMVYGLARMAADGHFPEWQLPQADTPATLHGVLDFFIASLVQRAGGAG